MADREVDGVDYHEWIVPYWGDKDSRYSMDFPLVLARAHEEFEKFQALQAKWEQKVKELEVERKAAEQSYEQMRAEINLPNAMAAQMLGMASCSKKERALLDALAGYLNWLDEEAE